MFPNAGTYHYNAAGSNTLTQVSGTATTLYHISLSNLGGSVGYLQVYNNGTLAIGAGTSAGTPQFTVALATGTAGGGATSQREVDYGPFGRAMSNGLSYLWSSGATGTTAHAVNSIIDISYRDK